MAKAEKLSVPIQTCLLFAARYAHDRNTGGAYVVVTTILNHWDSLDGGTKRQLKKEAKEATYNHDDWERIINKK